MKFNYLFTILGLIYISGCSKETKENDPTGTYTGIIYTNIKKTPKPGQPAGLTTVSENYNKVLSVIISQKNGNYYLDSNLMIGNGNMYTFTGDSAVYLFNISSQEIEYSHTSNREEFLRFPGILGAFRYAVEENATGILKK